MSVQIKFVEIIS